MGNTITVTFSEPMNPSSINAATFRVDENGTSVTGQITYSGLTAIFNPSGNLPFGTTLTATVTTGVEDLAGNPLAGEVSWSFTTEQESTPPTITATTPADNELDVPIASSITASFSEAMDPATLTTGSFQVAQNGTAIGGSVSYAANKATFTPTNNFDYNSTITATVTTDAQDLAGNGLDGPYAWSFTTEQESTPPTVVATDPATNATEVPVGRPVTITFSEQMNASTINSSTFTVAQNSSLVAGSVSLNGAVATFTPNEELPVATTLTATVTTGAEDLAGNALQNTYSWTFTTEQESTPPVVVSTAPANNAQNVQPNTSIAATFSEPLDGSTVNSSSFIVTQNGTAVGGSISYSGTTALFTPNTNLDFARSYTATLTTTITDLAGNPLAGEVSWSFTTEQESTPPTVVATNPADNTTGVAVDGTLSATFSEPMDPATINTTTVVLTRDGAPVSGSVSYSAPTVTFIPDSDLAFGSSFVATITTGVADLAGNNLVSNVAWSFTTEQESTPPTVVANSPANNATNVAIDGPITVSFSEPIASGTVTTGTFTLTNNGGPVNGNVDYDGSTNTATFIPTTDLQLGTTYTASVSTAIQDLAGNTLANEFSWSFTTEQESVPPEVSTVNPTEDAVDVPLASVIEATFSETLDAATVNSSTFTLTLNGSLVSGTVDYDGEVARFTPADSLEADTTYNATITTGIQDVVGNSLASEFAWSFRTIVLM